MTAMAVYFRVHPDKSNRDIFDENGKLYDADFKEAKPEDVHGNDVLVCATPDEFDVMRAART